MLLVHSCGPQYILSKRGKGREIRRGEQGERGGRMEIESWRERRNVLRRPSGGGKEVEDGE